MTGGPSPGVAVVTGAARGLGEAITDRYARSGWSVLVVDQDGLGAQRVVEAVRAAGGKAHALTVDLLREDAPQHLVDGALAAFGRVDVLVNNAGIAPLLPFLETTRDQLRQMLAVNFEMQYFTTQSVVRQMIHQGDGGCIVNIGTIHTQVGISGGTAYASSKAALTAWTRTLAVELAPHGIRCNTLAPGPIATPRVRRELTSDQISQRVARIPLGRMGDEADIAGCALFLASPDARFVNGHLLVVDGGLTISGAL